MLLPWAQKEIGVPFQPGVQSYAKSFHEALEEECPYGTAEYEVRKGIAGATHVQKVFSKRSCMLRHITIGFTYTVKEISATNNSTRYATMTILFSSNGRPIFR
jgi:hypothetical protein